MFFGDQSGSYFCGFTFWPAPRHCAGAVRYSFCMSPAWVSAPRGARFSIGRSLLFLKNSVFVSLFLFLSFYVLLSVCGQIFANMKLNIMIVCVWTWFSWLPLWFVTCYFALVVFVPFHFTYMYSKCSRLPLYSTWFHDLLWFELALGGIIS